ncbi:cell surface protein [Bacillus manliponensis]|uniref:cell surface protein n=1 Tax=Bacillus manliponensis TaxID=574376 RepID=UPI00351491F8
MFVNGAKKYGIITNTDTKEYNDKYISTDFPLIRGDYIYYNNMYWMIWNQVTVPRAENYKGIMRQAEHDVIFNLYYADVTSKYLLKCPAIIQRTSDYTQHYQSTVEMITLDSEIHVFVRDTPSTRKIIELVGKGDGEIIIGQRNYEIIGVSIEKKGYLNITCRLGIRNGNSDYVNNIYWASGGSKPSDWTDQYDLSLYEREGQPPVLPSAPNNYQTNMTFTKVTPTPYTSTQTGSIEATWTEEGNKQTYADFKGYKVRLLSNGSEIAMNLTSEVTATFNNLAIGTYSIEVTSRFGNNNTILPVTATVKIEDEDTSVLLPSSFTTNVDVLYYNDSNTYGNLEWSPEVKRNDFVDYGFYGYRVEVWSSNITGDIKRDYWVTQSTNYNIKRGWSGELGWYVLIYSLFQGSEMQPKRFEGSYLVTLPDESSPW